MGHADVTTTMRYLYYVKRPDELELVAEAFALAGSNSSWPPVPASNFQAE
jgi:hypothetical protein